MKQPVMIMIPNNVNRSLREWPRRIVNNLVFPALGIAAWKARQVQAFRFWVLTRSLDQDGRGCVKIATIFDHRKQLAEAGAKVPGERLLRTWERQAVDFGWVYPSNDGDHFLYYAGTETMAAKLRVDEIGRGVRCDVHHLLGPDWRAYLWALYLGANHREPISRARLSRITGVSTTTQSHWSRKAVNNGWLHVEEQAEVTPIAWTECSARGIEDVFGGHAFPKRVDGRVVVARRLPSIYRTEFIRSRKFRPRSIKRAASPAKCEPAGNGRTFFDPSRHSGRQMSRAFAFALRPPRNARDLRPSIFVRTRPGQWKRVGHA